MFLDIIQAFVLIFIAELGDKSQLLAMTMATKYSKRIVMIGVFFGILANHAIAIAFGSIIQVWLNPALISYIVGGVFLLFGFLSLLDQPHSANVKAYTLPPVLTVALLFFLGEFGDKTQFAALALSLESANPWLLLIGTVSAMMATSLIAIFVGTWLGDKFPEVTIRLISSLVFTGYGAIRLIAAIDSMIWSVVITLIAGIVYAVLAERYRRQSLLSLSDMKQVAKALKSYYDTLETTMDVLCLTEEVCGPCQLQGCLIGHVKYLIEEGKRGKPVSLAHVRSKAMKQVERKKVRAALDMTIAELNDHWDDSSYATLHQIRHSLEYLLYQKTLRSPTSETYQTDLAMLDQKYKGAHS